MQSVVKTLAPTEDAFEGGQHGSHGGAYSGCDGFSDVAHRGKLQAIQEGLPALPPDSLSDFVVGFSEIIETEIATPNRAEHTAVFTSFIQLW